MKSFFRSPIRVHVHALLRGVQQHDLGMGAWTKYRLLKSDKLPESRGSPIIGGEFKYMLSAGAIQVTGITCVIQIEPGHFVEPDDSVEGSCLQVGQSVLSKTGAPCVIGKPS